MPSELNIQPLDYTGVPEGYFRVGVVVPTYNCVVEKIVGEMGDFFKQNGIVIVLATEDKIRNLTEYFPDVVMYLRCGTQQGTPPNILAGVDGHTQYFRSLRIPVYYYLDDAYFQANNYAPLKILLNTDKVILATDALVKAVIAAGYKKPIHLLKTHMNIPIFDVLPKAEKVMDNDKFNIMFTSEGRIGTVMLDKICERMSQTPEKYKDVRILCITSQVGLLRAVINRWRGVNKVYYERVPLQEYYGLFKMMDLCIAPGDPEDLNYFLQPESQGQWLASKSCVKYTVSGASSIPCIASPHLTEYAMAITHGETGYIANNLDEWIQYIDLMINDPEKRKEIGENARRDVVKNWNIVTRTEQFSRILKGEDVCRVQVTPE